MQPLEFLPPAPVATTSIEPSSPKEHEGPPAPDDEFRRLMEQAMSPDHKNEDMPGNLPRKGKIPVVPSKGHISKAQPAQDKASVKTCAPPDQADNQDHLETAAVQPDESATRSKEVATPDATTGLFTQAGDASLALPIFLSLPVMEHPGAGNGTGGKIVTSGDLSVTQTGTGSEAAKTLPASLATVAIDVPVKNLGAGPMPGKIQPENSAAKTTDEKSAATNSLTGDKAAPEAVQKIFSETISPAVLTAGTKNSPPPPDSQTVTPTTARPNAWSEPVQVEKPVVVHLDSKDSGLAASTPAPTDDKLQAQPGAAAKLAEQIKNDGTGVAITPSSMKNSDKTNKVAGSDLQVLPGGTNGMARETVLPAHATVTAVRSSEKQDSDFNFSLPAAGPAPVDGPETSSMVPLPSLADARMRDVERTHDLVSIHALRMVDAKSDSLQVVIKPGAGTELSLELRHRNGSVEAEAVLQRGDFQLMNQHWPELQAKLEQRGIKLSTLGGETNFTATGNGSAGAGNFSRQQSSREEAAQKASAFAEFTVAMNRGGATARLSPAIAGGWESWA